MPTSYISSHQRKWKSGHFCALYWQALSSFLLLAGRAWERGYWTQTEELKWGRPGNKASMHAEWRNVLHFDAIILTAIQDNLSTHTSFISIWYHRHNNCYWLSFPKTCYVHSSHKTTVTMPLMYTILEHEKFSSDHARVQFHPSSRCVVCVTPINASLPIFLLHMHC